MGTMTGKIRNMSIAGVAIKMDSIDNCFVMMELNVKIHGPGWDETWPALPAQIVRVSESEIGLKFHQTCEQYWQPEEYNPEISLNPRARKNISLHQLSYLEA